MNVTCCCSPGVSLPRQDAFSIRVRHSERQSSSGEAQLKPAGLPGDTVAVTCQVTDYHWQGPEMRDPQQAPRYAVLITNHSSLPMKGRSAVCSALALISQPAAVAFLLTTELGVAHVSWKHGQHGNTGMKRDLIAMTIYSLRLE